LESTYEINHTLNKQTPNTNIFNLSADSSHRDSSQSNLNQEGSQGEQMSSLFQINGYEPRDQKTERISQRHQIAHDQHNEEPV